MKRSHWLPLIAAAGVAFLAGPMLSVARAQEPGLASYNPVDGTQLRLPNRPLLPSARIPKAGKQFDALSSTDFYQFVTQGRERLSNPDIAVGPDDIFVVAGQNRIMRVGNPNAPGAQQYGVGQFNPSSSPLVNYNNLKNTTHTSEVFLDTWVGTTVLSQICPGQFNPATCLIQYPTVRYDQMHGHFLVAFAITDTGVRGPDNQVTAGRASTWVLIHSRGASFVRADGTLDAPAGTSNVFTLPLPPPDVAGGGNNTGGLNASWYIYYGARNGPGGTSGMLNINQYTTHPEAAPLGPIGRYDPTNPDVAFPNTDCRMPTAGQGGSSVPPTDGVESVCYFPTEVRLGIDNDSIILVSPVVNVNQVVPNSNTIPFTTGRYAGNRVRVLSKYYIYNVLPLQTSAVAGEPTGYGNALIPGPYAPLTIGNYNQGLGQLVGPPRRGSFDMFRNTDLPAFCTAGQFNYATDQCTTPVPGFARRAYTLGLEISFEQTGIDNPVPPAAPTVAQSNLTPLYYEPVHLRGRTLAKYSNYTFGGLTHLIGSAFGRQLYVQTIVYRPDYRPALDPGINFNVANFGNLGIPGPRHQPVPDQSLNPFTVPQAGICSTTPCSSAAAGALENQLYIGDSRPRRAIYREGHIYDARVGRPFSNSQGTSIVSTNGAPNAQNELLRSTVYYDVIQTIYSSPIPALPQIGDGQSWATVLGNLQPQPSLIWYTFWQNGHFYAPMFDVPANVQRYGATSPSWLLPYFEKLFVGTTSPRQYFPAPSAGDTSVAVTNLCGTASVTFPASAQGNIWPSLYDVRQGCDKYDRFEWFRDPVSGRVADPTFGTNTTNVLATRAGAATDPIEGGLWVYGAFANFRVAGGVGQWATNAAYYDMSFADTDPYGTDSRFFDDVCPIGGDPACATPFFIYIQTARQLGLTLYLNSTSGPLGQAGVGTPLHGQDPARVDCVATPDSPRCFKPNENVTRAEMASFIVYSQFDGTTVDDYLAKTGGANFSSFADVNVGGGTGYTGAQQKAIEVMYRRGYTRGCYLTNDGTATFCPTDLTTRGQMAVFIIRAKMNNVHPTVLSGCVASGNPAPNPPYSCSNGGDKFWLFQTANAYFPGDTQSTHPFFAYIQKLRELRITAGNGVNGTGQAIYGSSLDLPVPESSRLKRGQMATFIVRAFHL